MTAPDPRLDEIQARAEGLTDLCPEYLRQGIRHLQRNCDIYCNEAEENDEHDCRQPDRYDGDRMAAVLADIPYLLAELRKAHEALAAVSAIEEVLDGWDALIPFHDAEESQRWYSLGKRHAAERIRTEIAEARAAVAAAKGDDRG